MQSARRSVGRSCGDRSNHLFVPREEEKKKLLLPYRECVVVVAVVGGLFFLKVDNLLMRLSVGRWSVFLSV